MAGESIQGVTIDDAELRPWLLSVLDALSAIGAIGPLTLQAFLTEDGPVLIEVNPRFGGGFPLTNAAGGTYPEWIVEMLAGGAFAPRFGEYRRGLYMTRYYAETYTSDPPW
jgi:carbamoyl-phosphate synthase large subunit